MDKTRLILLILLGSAMRLGAAEPPGIIVEVTGGPVSSTGRIVEQEIDLAGAAKALGREEIADCELRIAEPGTPSEIRNPKSEIRNPKVDPQSVRVVEIGASGENLGTMASQVDAGGEPGKYVVCWQTPGELAAGQTRRFRIVLPPLTPPSQGGEGPAPQPAETVTAQADGETTIVSQGPLVLTYSQSAGGMISRATVDGVSGDFSWADKAFDGGAVYYLANHRADQVRLRASGPLRVVVEAEGEYLDAGRSAPSRPRAVYRFTHYAGEPLVRVEARMTQDFAKQWVSLHFVEIHFDGAPITHFATDSQGETPLTQRGESFGGPTWAAVFGPKLLVGTCDSQSPMVWDGGGRHYGAYVRSGVAVWNSLHCRWRGALFWGKGPEDLDRLRQWSQIAAAPPTLKVRLEPLEKRVHDLNSVLRQKESALPRLSGKAWAIGHIAVRVAQAQLREAADRLAAGDCGAADRNLTEAERLLQKGGGSAQIKAQGSVLAGLAEGYPILANDRVAYVWSRPENGAGLLSICDRRRGQEFLKGNPAAASFWQVSVKRGEAGRSYSNVGRPGQVVAKSGGLSFVWEGPPRVVVRASLRSGEALLRMRLSAQAQDSAEGLVNVVFPAVDGVLPLTDGAAQDHILDTWALGELRPSPLVSGKAVPIEYPNGMQFTALYGEGRGLYVAEEDPQAHRKTLAWTSQSETGTLQFTISHPVLGWAGPQGVPTYASPGDVVIGPFRGDWYDAAQLYRKWALTAPWCAKGPIHSRRDYPKWLADAPYWTIGDLGDEAGIQRETDKLTFFGGPGVIHAYGYYFPQHQDDRYPEMFPPKLGSEGLKEAVRELQQRGAHLVPYVNGQLWDQDTESYRTEQAENATLRWPGGGMKVHTSYGGGQALVSMCPGSRQWRDKLTALSREIVGRYGFDGVYYDFLTIHTDDCTNPEHGHPLGGGNFWTAAVRDLYGHIRTELKKIRPDVMLTGEDNAEWVIDLLDTALSLGKVGTPAPAYQAVYHGYTLVYGGQMNQTDPCIQGRWWLLGNQNGWHNVEPVYVQPPNEKWKRDGEYYRRLLHCHYQFGRPYLAYGRMLRMPTIRGALPTVTGLSSYGPYTVPAVEGSAWQAPDGTVGVFFLNYEDTPHEFTWGLDLAEAVGWKTGQQVKMSQWTEEAGLKGVAEVRGGRLRREATLEGRGLMALKLEVVK